MISGPRFVPTSADRGTMAFSDTLLSEFDHEMKTTRSLLERVPLDNYDWKPHPKSTGLGALASHIASLAGFGQMIVEQDGRDFGANGPFVPPSYRTTDELLSTFDKNVALSRDAIK